MLFHIVFGIALALLLNVNFRGKRFLRTIVLIPWAMPMVVAGLAARWAFNDEYGLINDLIRRFNSSFHLTAGLFRLSPLAVVAVDLWKTSHLCDPGPVHLQFNPVSFKAADRWRQDPAGFSGISPGRGHQTVLTISIFSPLWRLPATTNVYSMTPGGGRLHDTHVVP
jgi:multiple sugar transport system permease protein